MKVTGVKTTGNVPLTFAFVPGNSWFSLSDNLTAPTDVVVNYQTSPSPDIIVADGCGYIRFFPNAGVSSTTGTVPNPPINLQVD